MVVPFAKFTTKKWVVLASKIDQLFIGVGINIAIVDNIKGAITMIKTVEINDVGVVKSVLIAHNDDKELIAIALLRNTGFFATLFCFNSEIAQ
ncbi:hypothetical protein [Pseudoalteromonas distincta]|uniref:hypothetical protein n=1 Tax=Pseudoalteromonas distincta TaxID=77608 RepID=UPI0039E8A25B